MGIANSKSGPETQKATGLSEAPILSSPKISENEAMTRAIAAELKDCGVPAEEANSHAHSNKVQEILDGGPKNNRGGRELL